MALTLFIGGSADGESKQIKHIPPYVQFYGGLPKDDDPYCHFSTETYKLEQFIGNSKRFTVAVLEGLTPDDAIQMLIDGYKPNVDYKKLWNQLITDMALSGMNMYSSGASHDDVMYARAYQTVQRRMEKMEREQLRSHG